MHEEGHSRVINQIQSLFGRWVRGHYNNWVGVEGRRGKECIVHQRDMGKQGIACRKM